MDLDIALKLAALGWNGREDLYHFFKRDYSLRFRTVVEFKSPGRPREGELIISWSKGGTSYCVTFSGVTPGDLKKKIEKVLLLFYTENGEIHGPDRDNIKTENEWT